MKDLDYTQSAVAGGTLRDALKRETASDHARLDRLQMHLDISDAADREVFCAINLRGFSQLAECCERNAAEATEALGAICDALEQETGRSRRAHLRADCARLSPDAVAYLVLGSQLGTAALSSFLPEGQRTGYFAVPADRAAWGAFCQRLGGRASTGAEEKQIIDNARAAFGLFIEATVDELKSYKPGLA